MEFIGGYFRRRNLRDLIIEVLIKLREWLDRECRDKEASPELNRLVVNLEKEADDLEKFARSMKVFAENGKKEIEDYDRKRTNPKSRKRTR